MSGDNNGRTPDWGVPRTATSGTAMAASASPTRYAAACAGTW
jgi:hypothetical protein